MDRGCHLSEEFIHLTAGAVFLYFALPVVVFVAEEVIAEEWVVNEGLKNNVHETGLPQIQ
jgi:hypothetical protein